MTGVLIVYAMRSMFFTFLIENVMRKSSRKIFQFNILILERNPTKGWTPFHMITGKPFVIGLSPILKHKH